MPAEFHYFSAADNRFYEQGFPLPERRGTILSQKQFRVFMDDLFLCPIAVRFTRR